jgi:hypothetical protein
VEGFTVLTNILIPQLLRTSNSCIINISNKPKESEDEQIKGHLLSYTSQKFVSAMMETVSKTYPKLSTLDVHVNMKTIDTEGKVENLCKSVFGYMGIKKSIHL